MPKTKSSRRVIASASGGGYTVSIAPRDGHPTQAQARWHERYTKKRQRRTIAGVRLTTAGKPVTGAARTQLQDLASLLHKRLMNRQPMPGDAACPSWDVLLEQVSPAEPQKEAVSGSALTVREVLAKAYGPSYAEHVTANGRISGRYARGMKNNKSGGLAVSTWTPHARDLRRVADVIEELLGGDTPWSWSEGTYIELRDALIRRAAEAVDHTRAPQKLRRVQRVLQTYIRGTRLAQKAYRERDGAPQALTMNRWLTDLKTAWAAAGLPLPDGDQPRYDRAEAGLIYEVAISRHVDPRYGLWLTLGLEGRPVQILRACRLDLVDTYPDTPAGIFRGPTKPLKHGLIYAPTRGHRLKIQEYLDGYLRDYERAYQAGKIENYPLFPSGDIKAGEVVPLRESVRPWGYRQFLGDPKLGTGFYGIEREAGVANVPGRGPYAFKYLAADLAPGAAARQGVNDIVAVNLATAHDTPGTATQYRQNARSQPAILVSVGKILWQIQRDLREAAAETRRAVLGESAVGEYIKRYRISQGGISLETGAGVHLWVPWSALTRHGGQPHAAVEKLERRAAVKWPGGDDIDEMSREIQLPGGVVMQLEAMMLAATAPGEKGPADPELRRAMWWD